MTNEQMYHETRNQINMKQAAVINILINMVTGNIPLSVGQSLLILQFELEQVEIASAYVILLMLFQKRPKEEFKRIDIFPIIPAFSLN